MPLIDFNGYPERYTVRESEETEVNETQCNHIFRHPQTKEEREQLINDLEYFRKIGDSHGIPITLARLTEKCE